MNIISSINIIRQARSGVRCIGDNREGARARAIHFASTRESRPFVAVNCGAIPDTLIESELFGYVRGAFTGANADRRGLMEEPNGGRLFLDEVGELPLALQVRFTRALQERAVRPVGATREKKVDVRVISATNVDLKSAVAARAFREDLFYRLNVFPIRLPPLRERGEDIVLLAAHLLERHALRLGVHLDHRRGAFGHGVCDHGESGEGGRQSRYSAHDLSGQLRQSPDGMSQTLGRAAQTRTEGRGFSTGTHQVGPRDG